MANMTPSEMHERLSGAGVCSDPGLSSQELEGIEEKYGFRFPPDLREFLAEAVPKFEADEQDTPSWPDWREQRPGLLQQQFDWPLQGICFDIEHNDFWLEEWGERPLDLAARFEIARHAVAASPVLIPIYGHRYMPSLPATAGNPIFSVYQTDIIIYGIDLLDYLCNEFPMSFVDPGPPARQIDFWSALTG